MIKIIQSRISEEELKAFLGKPFFDMIKFVVDIRREIVALGGELHSDAEALLIKEGSSQADLWGGNFYPARPQGSQITYASFINIRPSQENRAFEVQGESLRAKMNAVLEKLIL